MRFFRPLGMLLVVGAVSACHDSTAPIVRVYELTSIDGQSLPVTSVGIDGGSTILSGKLYLTEAGGALSVRHFHDYSANFGGSTAERTEQLPGNYRIANDSIRLSWRVEGCSGPCIADDVGVFDSSNLTLTADVPRPIRPVYTYRLVAGL
ncbi:MAG: hypothetical protein ACJ79X_16035 [Gemmatimonadaceae bacterium]